MYIHTDRQTYRHRSIQTDAAEIIYHSASRVVTLFIYLFIYLLYKRTQGTTKLKSKCTKKVKTHATRPNIYTMNQ